MLTFACKKIRQEELIRCSFSLNKTEYNVLIFLLKNNGKQTVLGIAKKIGLERTTIQKALKTLLKRGLVKRVQRNLPQGSYLFLYQVNKKEEIKQKTKQIVQEWVKVIEREIENL